MSRVEICEAGCSVGPARSGGLFSVKVNAPPDGREASYRFPDEFTEVRTGTLHAAEDPDTPARWDEVVRDDNYGIITKVMAPPSDHVRALFVNDETVPFAVVGCRVVDFNLMDPDIGVQRYIPKDKDRHRVKIEEDVLMTANFSASEAETPWRTPEDVVEKLKNGLVDKYLSGTRDTVPFGMFTAEDKVLKYGDTSLVFQSRAELVESCRTALEKTESIDVNHMIITVLEGDKDTGLAASVTVNGVPFIHTVRETTDEATLHYVNGKKIAKPDLHHVIGHVLCYPGDPDGYQRFVDTASRVSLKFYSAMSKGVRLSVRGKWMGGIGPSGRIGGHDGGSGGDRALSTYLRFEKKYGTLSKVLLLGSWRRVSNFDGFCGAARYIGGLHYRGRPYSLYNPWQENATFYAGSDLFRKLYAMSYFLHPDDRLDFNPEWFSMHRSTNSYTHDCLGIRRDCRTDVDAWTDGVGEQLSEFFREALERDRIRIERSRELLEEIMAQTGARRVEDGGAVHYLVRGMSGNTYAVDEATAAVTGPGGSHICIVAATSDKSGFDYISSLLVALSKDSVTAKNIHTLRSHVGKAVEDVPEVELEEDGVPDSEE